MAGLLAWLVPGSGHLYIGRPRKAAIVFAGVTALFVVGCLMAGGRNLSYYQYTASFCVQALAAGPCLAGVLIMRSAGCVTRTTFA